MSLLQLAIIALLQGTTEWLPVSSSGHVLLAAGFFEASPRDELLINAVSNLGTLSAMLIYFRKDVASAIAGGAELAAAPVRKAPLSNGARLAAAVIVATPVALLVAILYEMFLPEDMLNGVRNIYVVAATTILFGALLWWADVKGERTRTEADMTLWHAFLIGATQAIAAILPGTSRSGITMTAARALGYDRTEAARFSMLIGAPILAAAGIYGLLGLMVAESSESALTLQDGLAVAGISFVTGLASIWFLMALLSRMSFLPFVIYRFALGGILLLGSPAIGLF